jgi:hypothetical protein
LKKSHFCVINLIEEFNVLSKSGLGIEIGQFYAEIKGAAGKGSFSEKSNKLKYN